MWNESGVSWVGPVDVSLTATYAGTGEIVVRGSVEGELARECRRCLEPVRRSFEHDLTVVFVASDSSDVEDDDGVHVYDPSDELDLSNAVREEVIFTADPYVVCEPRCQGLCPRCGVNRNNDPCDCTSDELDPRWEALRALKEK